MATTRLRRPKEQKAAKVAAPLLPQDQTIHSRAMLVSLTISAWTARKFDKEATAALHSYHDAHADSGRYNKKLFAHQGAAHAAILAAASAARSIHYEHTLPWGDDGWRLLPTANYVAYTDAMRAAKSKFDNATNGFVMEYPEMISRARRALGRLFKKTDYPDPVEMQRMFGLAVEFNPVPSGSDFRLSLPTDQLEQIEHDVTARVTRATNAAMRDAWDRLYDSVAHIHDKMVDPMLRDQSPSGAARRASLRESLLDQARSTCDVLGRLNVMGDTKLDDMRHRVEQALQGANAEMLRAEPDLCAQLAADTAAIMDQMKDIYGGRN